MEKDDFEQKGKIFKLKLKNIVIAACIIILFYFIVQRFSGVKDYFGTAWIVIQPIFIGFVMAFLMNPIMQFFEKHLKKPLGKLCKKEATADKANRVISAILALVFLVGLVVLFFATAVPALIDAIVYLVNNIDEQIAGVLDWVNDITGGRYAKSLAKAKEQNIDGLIKNATDFITPYLNVDQDEILGKVTSSVYSIVKLIINLLIGMFVSVYVLIDKEHFKGQAKKMVCGLLKPHYANIVLDVTRKSAEIFYGFIIGKIIDSIIIGILCYIGCLIMHMPYAILVSVIVGVTNVIPVFGPYIGAVPTVIIIFLTEPMQGIYFLIFVLILQQFDGNWLGPKILGDSTGISSFWVVFAVVVGGGLFGVAGMIIGVPVMAVIYYLISRFSNYLVHRRNLSEQTAEYINMDKIDEDTNTLVMRTEEEKAERISKAKLHLFVKKKK